MQETMGIAENQSREPRGADAHAGASASSSPANLYEAVIGQGEMGQGPTLQADSDVYRYLAGTQPVQPMGIAGPTPTHEGYGFQLHGSGAAFPGINGEVVPVQSNVKGAAASPPNLTASELGMIMKSLQAFVPEFPKLELLS